jgi:hypothetical protein
MGPLLNSELRRFRGLALVLATVHLAVLTAVATSTDFFLPSAFALGVGAVAYSFTGLALGLYQIGSWRRGDLWIHLLHRPLAPGRIFLALVTAAALLLVAVVAMPLVAVTALIAVLDPQGVDPRHFQLAAFAAGCAVAFYLLGCLQVLTPRGRRTVALATVTLGALFLAPAAPAVPSALGALLFVPQLLVLGWLGWLTVSSFGPNLATPSRRPLAVVAAAVPVTWVLFLALTFGLLLLYSLGVVVGEQGWRGFARHAWDDYFPAGSYARATYLEAPAALRHGLRLAGSPRGVALAAEVATTPVVEIAPLLRAFPVRHQPALLDRYAAFEDPPRRTRWTFRHDRMLFAGRSLRTGQAVGWLGPGGAAPHGGELQPFAEVPYAFATGYLLTARRLYRFDGARQAVDQRFALTAGERFVAAPLAAATLDLALSDRALYVFAPGSLLGRGAAAVPLARVPLPGEASNLERALAARVGDGLLASFLLGTRSERELRPARQLVVWVAGEGRQEVIADRELSAGPPPWVRHRGFLVSPLLQCADDLVRSALLGGERMPGKGAANLRELLAHPPPLPLLAVAAALAALAAASTWILAGRRGFDAAPRVAWTAAALLGGPPVFFASLLFTAPPDG